MQASRTGAKLNVPAWIEHIGHRGKSPTLLKSFRLQQQDLTLLRAFWLPMQYVLEMLSGPLQLATEILTALKRKSLWISLIGLALLVAAIGPVGIILAGYLVAGAEAGVFFRITREASLGSNQGPRFEMFSPFEDVFLPLVLVFLAVLPIIAANYWAGGALTDLYAVGTEYGPTPGEWELGPKLLLGIGILLYPLLICMGATTQSISAVLRPRLGSPVLTNWVSPTCSPVVSFMAYGLLSFSTWQGLQFELPIP